MGMDALCMVVNMCMDDGERMFCRTYVLWGFRTNVQSFYRTSVLVRGIDKMLVMWDTVGERVF